MSQNRGRSTVPHNQLGPALGPDIIKTLAQRSGLSEEELTKQLSEVLPGVVDKLTHWPDSRRWRSYLKQCEQPREVSHAP